MVFQWAKTHQLPVGFVFAGGYEGTDLTLDRVVDLHRLTIEAARHAQAARHPTFTGTARWPGWGGW